MVIAYDYPYNTPGVNNFKASFDGDLSTDTLHNHTMDSHGSPYIKNEEDDFSSFNNQGFMSMPQQFPTQQYHQNMDMGSVNPSELTMGNGMNNSFGNGNLSGSFIVGKSNITDDELLDLGEFNPQDNRGQMQQNSQAMYQNQAQQGGMAMSQQRMQQVYSHTPEGAPIMSPFQNGNFDYSGFGPSGPGSVVQQNGSFRNKLPASMTRHASDRSPMTPKINGLHLGTPDSGSYLSNQRLHNRGQSNAWDGTPGSNSWVDTPAQSPHQGGMHANQISEVLGGKHASLPAKVEGGSNYQASTQEAKRRRRRESHNLVERRRRDNINERIQDLSKLVPQHRLEDEKIRKHIQGNGPLSPGLAASGISPPQATSLLAGGSGRRAAGGITQGLPPDEKDKGPNKGDILNSSVSWTRDLMWLLHEKIEQEQQLREVFASEGRAWPFTVDENEKRMISELTEAVQRNGAANFHYSRYPGSSLRVPKHTNYAGEPLQGPGDSPQSLSPGVASGSGGSGVGEGGANDPNSFWVGHQPGNNDMDFALKEEDEMDMNLE